MLMGTKANIPAITPIAWFEFSNCFVCSVKARAMGRTRRNSKALLDKPTVAHP